MKTKLCGICKAIIILGLIVTAVCWVQAAGPKGSEPTMDQHIMYLTVAPDTNGLVVITNTWGATQFAHLETYSADIPGTTNTITLTRTRVLNHGVPTNQMPVSWSSTNWITNVYTMGIISQETTFARWTFTNEWLLRGDIITMTNSSNYAGSDTNQFNNIFWFKQGW